MRSIWRSGAPVLLAAALLAGCSLQGAGGATSAPPDSGVAEHWSVLEGAARLPAVGTRWTSGPMEELTPSPDYGELVPYAGAGYYLVYPDGEGGTVQSPSLSTLYGLMTVDGCAVLDPVCTGVYASSYLDGQGTSHTLPVWELTRTDPEAGNPRNGRLTALAARDGSWVTPFRYWAAAGSPLGVFAGDGTGLSLLSTETGEVLKSWTWAQLGVEDLEDFPWFANDMETTAQWAGDAFFLGIWGEGYTAHLLDPETGAVATLSAQAWYERDGARYTAQTGWQAEAAEDGTVTVSKGDTSYNLPEPPAGGAVPLRPGGPGVLLRLRLQRRGGHHPGGEDRPHSAAGTAQHPVWRGCTLSGRVPPGRGGLDPVFLGRGGAGHPPRRDGQLVLPAGSAGGGAGPGGRGLLPSGLRRVRVSCLVRPGGAAGAGPE